MKRNVILMVLGIVMAMMLSSCAQGAPASIVGQWDITGGTMYLSSSSYTSQYLDIKDNGDMFWIRVDNLGSYGTTTPYYTIKSNSCGELQTTGDAKFKYEFSGDNLTLRLKSGSGLVDALLDDWAVCKKRK